MRTVFIHDTALGCARAIAVDGASEAAEAHSRLMSRALAWDQAVLMGAEWRLWPALHPEHPLIVVEMRITSDTAQSDDQIRNSVRFLTGGVGAGTGVKCRDGARCAAMPWCPSHHGTVALPVTRSTAAAVGTSHAWDAARRAGVSCGLIAYPFYESGACAYVGLCMRGRARFSWWSVFVRACRAVRAGCCGCSAPM